MSKEEELTQFTEKYGLIEVKDVLDIFKVTEDTFRTWIKDEKLPENLIVKIGHTVRIRSAVLANYLLGNV